MANYQIINLNKYHEINFFGIIYTYTIRRKVKNKYIIIKSITIIDTITRGFKIMEYDDKRAINITNLVEEM